MPSKSIAATTQVAAATPVGAKIVTRISATTATPTFHMLRRYPEK